MSTAAIVPQHLVDRIRAEYEAGGVSMMELSVTYDLSETTVYRIIKKVGAYRRETVKPVPLNAEEQAAAIKASEERLFALLNKPEVPDPFIVPNPYYDRKPK